MSINPIIAIRDMWLVELLENESEGLPIKKIMEIYQSFPPQIGNNVSQSQVSERTIHNWIKEIDEIFHIKILCGKGKKKYRIENEDSLDSPTVEIARQIKKCYDEWVRVIYSQRRNSLNTIFEEFSLGFMQVGNSMLNGVSLTIQYGKKNYNKIDFDEPCIFKPFFTKVIEDECYVIGEIRPISGLWSERIEVYSLDRLSFIEEGDYPVENYTIPYDFTPTDYYEDGNTLFHIGKYKDKPMVVFLNANNDTADYLRKHPIAQTQTEIESNRKYNKNLFMVVVIPNEDFFTQILSFGEELTITNPDFLKREGEDKNVLPHKAFGYKKYKEDLIGYDYRFLNTANILKRRGIGVDKLLQTKYNGLKDDELVFNFQQGDGGAFEMLFNKYKNNILRYLETLSADFYEDLNSITWQRAYNALREGHYKESGQFENWVKVIAKNTFRNWCKKRERVPQTAYYENDDNVLQIIDKADDPELSLLKKERTERLNRLIADLPPQMSRVLELDRNGYSYKEIAKIEGISIGMVKRIWERGVRALQDKISKLRQP